MKQLSFSPTTVQMDLGGTPISLETGRIAKQAAGSVIVPEANDRRPHFGVYWDPPPMDSPWWPFPPTSAPVLGRSEPITGGWLQARFDAGLITTGRFDVVVKDGAATLGSAQFDMGAVR